VLGIFGREGLDAATAWALPQLTDMAFAAYRLYRNYDGQGSGFGTTSVSTVVTDSSSIQAYSAIGAKKLTVVMCNENANSASVNVRWLNFTASSSSPIMWFANNPSVTSNSDIQRKSDLQAQSNQVTLTLDALSINLIVIQGLSDLEPLNYIPPWLRDSDNDSDHDDSSSSSS